jgi:uncharacterized membrane-anchored protein
MMLPNDHPDRRLLADEVHARPPEPLNTPARATHIALMVSPEQRALELSHLRGLCARFGVEGPDPDTIYFVTDLGDLRLKWERHGEFSSYTFFGEDLGSALFDTAAATLAPPEWLSALPGSTIFAAHAQLMVIGAQDPDAGVLSDAFEGNAVVGAGIADGAGLAFADFKVHADGFSRILIFNRSMTRQQAGLMVQRLFEIETYRMMALLALPLARKQSAPLAAIESALVMLTDDIARNSVADESLLQQLTNLAADVESRLAANQFRFGACKAYNDLVMRRIAELREQRIAGMQTIEEFMVRRFTPAVATCASTAQRLQALSERVAQTSALLSTRVDIARAKQNQMLLGSMNRRARLQLRLQQTVEIISIIPITYYLTGLVGYGARALDAAGFPIAPDIAEGIAIPVMAILVAAVFWRMHHKVVGHTGDADALEL